MGRKEECTGHSWPVDFWFALRCIKWRHERGHIDYGASNPANVLTMSRCELSERNVENDTPHFPPRPNFFSSSRLTSNPNSVMGLARIGYCHEYSCCHLPISFPIHFCIALDLTVGFYASATQTYPGLGKTTVLGTIRNSPSLSEYVFDMTQMITVCYFVPGRKLSSQHPHLAWAAVPLLVTSSEIR